jgi:cell division protease FtsH
MEKTLTKLVPEKVKRRGKRLEDAAGVLKDEFVGLDMIIDGILEAIRSWYLVPELQSSPLVVNLL